MYRSSLGEKSEIQKHIQKEKKEKKKKRKNLSGSLVLLLVLPR